MPGGHNVVLGEVDCVFFAAEIDDEELDDLTVEALDELMLEEGSDGNATYVANPVDKRVVIAGIVGFAVLGGAVAWWLLRKKPPSATSKGKIICPNLPYPGLLAVGDYVVIELGANDGSVSEPTWGQVLSRNEQQVQIRIVGETGEGDEPVPLATEKHGYSVGDELTIGRNCVFDRFRPTERWHVLCAQALDSAGFTPISRGQASLLGNGDRAQVVVRGLSTNEPIWLDVEGVSQGQQTLRGVVFAQPVVGDHGLQPGDMVEFLRDCVVDAEFGVGLSGG